MKKYLLASLLLIPCEEIMSLASLSIVLIMVLCDFAKAAEREKV